MDLAVFLLPWPEINIRILTFKTQVLVISNQAETFKLISNDLKWFEHISHRLGLSYFLLISFRLNLSFTLPMSTKIKLYKLYLLSSLLHGTHVFFHAKMK